MKTIFACIPNRKLFLFVVISLSAITLFSQPDYIFKNSSLISGTNRQIGAKYRFPGVKPGVDGIMTIMDIKKVTLTVFDGTGNGGFDEAFQPEIDVPRKSKGYVEFQLDFVLAGTTTATTMTEVPLTAIDIDGYVYPDEKVYEFDEFETSASYYIRYDLLGTSLDIKFNPNWVSAINKTAVDYPGVDTVRKNVMFTMVHAGVSSVTFRVGGDNKSNTIANRLRSVYFKKFNYPGVVLGQLPLAGFSGKKDKNNIQLNWQFSSIAGIKECSVERSVNGQAFSAISTNVFGKTSAQLAYSYTDISPGNGTYTYRLKITDENNKVFYSQSLLFKQNNEGTTTTMNIYPNVIQHRASVQVTSEAAANTSLQVVDYSGRVMYKESVQLLPGTNSIDLDVAGKIAKGNYIVAMSVNGKIISEKIIIQ
jgi:hypothetical protein